MADGGGPEVVIRRRYDLLLRLRAHPEIVPQLRAFYAGSPGQFIDDWGCTTDPRLVERGLPATIPLTLWPKQWEFVAWLHERWRRGEAGICEKARDSGASWLAAAFAAWVCLFHRGAVVAFGSRKLEYADELGNAKSCLEKVRVFIAELPTEFRPGWSRELCAPHRRVLFPATGSLISAEGGDQLGRGDRTSLYFVDEAAHLEHDDLVDAALSQTTRCRIDISTPNGMGNSFARRRHSGKFSVFSFRWSDDPRKTQAWLAQQESILDPFIVAREIMCDYLGSTEGQLIPARWIQSAIDAHVNLGIEVTGQRYAALDLADQGADLCSFAARHGILLEALHSWSGASGSIFKSTAKCMTLCEQYACGSFWFDVIGVGADCRGAADEINHQRIDAEKKTVHAMPFVASGAVPDGRLIPERENKDVFTNLKSYCWWHLRSRFAATHAAIAEGRPYLAGDLISLDGRLEELSQLVSELSQIQFGLTNIGKIAIEKTPPGCSSPNRADALMMCFNPIAHNLEVWRLLGAATV